VNILLKENKKAASLNPYFALVSIVFVVFIAIAVSFFEGQVKEDVLDSIDQEFVETNQRLKEIVTTTLSEYKSDLRFLYSTPPISGLPRAHFNNGIDPYDGTSYQQWKERLETIFIGFMENNLAVEQVRVIAVTAEGNELIRVQRVGASVEASADYSLQSKSGEPYFLPSTLLEPKQVYMSPLSLNREFGEIEFPFKPMIRFSIPIYSENGKRFAFLIMNVNASTLLNNLKETVFDTSQLIISGSDGDFIIHPLESYQFSRDLNPSVNWQAVYTENIKYNGIYLIKSKANTEEQFYVRSEKLYTRSGNKYGFVNFNLLAPKEYVDNLINEKRLITYSLLFAVIVFTSILLITFYRNAIRSQLLAETRQEASAIVDGSIDAIIALNLKGYLTSLNHTAERLLLISSKAAVGKSSKEIEFLSNLPIDEYVKKIQSSRAQIKDECSFVQGEYIAHYAISVSPVFSEHSNLSGLALIIRDISKEKQAEIKVKRLNSELEAKVRKRTHALAEAKDEAIKHSEVKSAFISNVSHELRTSLNGVIGTLNILKREALTDKSRKLVDMMELSASSLNLLINDILDLSKIEAGKLDLNIQLINPLLLIESLVSSCAVRAFDKGVDVYLDTTELSCDKLEVDPLRLTQIINNLISNAIKFTEKGFIKIKVSSEHVANNEYKLRVSVQDTGIGIDPLSQKRLFGAFQQASSAITEKFGGTGLGISICKQLCHAMGGEIYLDSTLNQGSTFSFYIKARASERNLKQEKRCFSSKHVLVCSQNAHIIEIIEKLVVLYGGHVSVSSLSELDLHDDENIDFAIIDDEEINNNTSLDHLHETHSSTHVVLLHQSDTSIPKSKAGKVSKISKPLTQTALLRVAGVELRDNETHTLLHDNSDGEFAISNERLSQIKGSKVLIVDDNKINLEVAKGALDELPIEILTANNGQEAIEHLLQSEASGAPVNCVLLDCQMPTLNGYQVSEKIRSGEAGGAFINVPVIAMTASAMMGEKEKCLSVGMNDYLSKPIKADDVLSKVVKWILSDHEQQTEEHVSTVDEAQSLWNRQEALVRLLNKEALLKRICQIFMINAPKKLTDLKDQFAVQNHAEVHQTAHALKGMCGELSADKLRKLCEEIELKAREQNLEIKDTLQKLERLLPQLMAEIKGWLESLER
jgi:PAS domain S-box-containing protein